MGVTRLLCAWPGCKKMARDKGYGYNGRKVWGALC